MRTVVGRLRLSCIVVLVSTNYCSVADISQYEMDVNTNPYDMPMYVSKPFMEKWNEVKYVRNVEKKRAFRKIFRDMMMGYDKALSPTMGTSEEFQFMRLSTRSRALIEINEVENRMSTIMSFKCQWWDDRLALPPNNSIDEYGIALDEDLIWKPDLFITNPHEEKSSSNKDDISSSLFLYLQWKGRVVWRFTRVVETRCKINTRYFPFDRQVCEVELRLNVEYFMFALKFVHLVDKDEFRNGNWKCINHSVYQYINTLDSFLYARITFVFERNPMRPALFFILPLFLLVFLSPLVFLVPADTNDRVSFAVTVLLATSLYMSLVADKLPDSSDPIPIIIIVFFLWYIYNALCCLICRYYTRVKPNRFLDVYKSLYPLQVESAALSEI